MSSTTSFSVKAQLDDDIRRVRIPVDIAGAATALGETFATDPALLQIFWRDEDGDLITIKTDDDMQEAIRSGATRLHIKKASSAATTMPVDPAPTPTTTPAPAPTPTPPSAAPAPAPAPVVQATVNVAVAAAAEVAGESSSSKEGVHFGVICDISGMSPIKGARYQMAGYDYDLCETEFNKLAEDDKTNYVVIATPGTEAVRYQPKAAKTAAPATQAADPAPAPKAATAAPKAATTTTTTTTTEAVEAVHRHIVCDKSGMNPIRGTRYHLAGCNYDLCEAEFNKLSDEEKVKFVVIARRGDRPTPYGQEDDTPADAAEGAEFEQFLQQIFGVDAAPAIHQIKVAFEGVNAEVAKKFAEHQAAAAASAGPAAPAPAPAPEGKCGGARGGKGGKGGGCPMRGGRWARQHGGPGHPGHHHHHRQQQKQQQQHGGWHQRVANASIPLGDRLPAGPIGFRSFGPGVAQLQIALIKAGVLDESAIRMHTGKFGPRTAEAIHALQEKYSLGGEPGVFDDNVAATLLGKLDGTIAEPEAAPEPEPEPEVEVAVAVAVEVAAPAPAPAPVVTPVAPSAPPSKWQSELEVLAGMGFTDEAVLTPLLEKHTGSIIFVMTELLG